MAKFLYYFGAVLTTTNYGLGTHVISRSLQIANTEKEALLELAGDQGILRIITNTK